MKRFSDRAEAGRLLAPEIAALAAPTVGRGAGAVDDAMSGTADRTGEEARPDMLVVGLPRGGVIVAGEVAAALGVPLDVIIVQKIGHPDQPELAIGALGENGVRVIEDGAVRSLGITGALLAEAEARASTELRSRVERFRRSTSPAVLTGRHVVIVDDGIATGATAAAACQVAKAAGAARITLAVPVAPHGWEARFADLADDLIDIDAPRSFGSVGRFYDDFAQTTDAEVLTALDTAVRRTAL